MNSKKADSVGCFHVDYAIGDRKMWSTQYADTLDEALKAADATLNIYRATYPGLTATIIESRVVRKLN